MRARICTLVAFMSIGVIDAPAQANAPSHANGVIAFQRNDDNHGEIWVVDPSVTEPADTVARVTTGPDPEARPAYGQTSSSDASDVHGVLAFQRLTTGQWDIYSRPANRLQGQPPRFDAASPLVAGPGNQTEPAYYAGIGTPLLAYVSDQTGRRELWLRDATGKLTQLTHDGAGYANPDFAGRARPIDSNGDGSIDGSAVGLAFESDKGGIHGIWAMDVVLDAGGAFVSAGAPRQVVAGPQAAADPSWQTVNDHEPGTADVRKRSNELLFTSGDQGSSSLAYIQEPWSQVDEGPVQPAVPFASLANVSPRLLTDGPANDSDSVWAPDGDRVAFVREDGGDTDIWVMAFDGSNPKPLVQNVAGDAHPTWQPASEPSQDTVDGHEQPPLLLPRLAITRARWHRNRMSVSGSAAPRLTGRVRLTFACGTGSRRRLSTAVTLDGGSFQRTLRTPRACRAARRGTVTLAYDGDRSHLPGRLQRRVRRR
jgi:hypothetical protein